MKISIDDGAKLQRANAKLCGTMSTDIWKATYHALKRAGDTAKTKAGTFAAQEYAINKGTFMRNTNMKSKIDGGYSSGGVASMSITFAGRVLPLLEFKTRYSRGGRLTTSVKRNGGSATLQHAFVEAVYGKTAVFERDGAPRFPVHQLYGPSTAQMMANDEVQEEMEKAVQETFTNRFDHEVARILNGW